MRHNSTHTFVTIDRGARLLPNGGWREYDRLCNSYLTKENAQNSEEVILGLARVETMTFAIEHQLFD